MVQILSLPPTNSGKLEHRGVAVTASHLIPLADLAGLVFVPAAGFSGAATFQYTASDEALFAAAPATVTLQIVSTAKQAATLQDQVVALRDTGELNKGEANSLLVKLNLKGNGGDAGKVESFLNKVDALLRSGILSPAEADALLGLGNALLTGLRRR